MTDGTQPTAPDPDFPSDPDTAEPAPEAPNPDQPTDPGTPGPGEERPSPPSVSPTATHGGPVSSELDGAVERPEDERPTNIDRD